MKKALLLVLGLSLIAGSAMAQPGAIMLYSDLTFADCNLVDGAPGLLQVYAVHNFTAGATASQFAVDASGAPTLSYLSWAAAHSVSVGSDPNVGVAVTYNGGCNAGPVLVGTISYFASGLSAPCSDIEVIADTGAVSGQVEGVDCAFQSTFPNRSLLSVNGQDEPTCLCGEIVPVEETNWGRVKALYN